MKVLVSEDKERKIKVYHDKEANCEIYEYGYHMETRKTNCTVNDMIEELNKFKEEGYGDCQIVTCILEEDKERNRHRYFYGSTLEIQKDFPERGRMTIIGRRVYKDPRF